MATEDERYRTSSQFKQWSFSPAQLAHVRAKTNAMARLAIAERLSSSFPPAAAAASATPSANPSGANTPVRAVSTATATATAPAPAPAAADVPPELAASASAGAPSPLPDFLTPDEEEQILRYYTVETLRAAEFCGLPTEIRATAAVFLRRFYLTHSVMTYPPTKMLKTAVFFGAKAENYYPRVKMIADNFPRTTGEEILAGEFLLCQGIRFAFDVRHPFRALEGAVMQLHELGGLEKARIEKGHLRAREILKFSPIVTDAYFHYTPSQIMLAVLSIADDGLCSRLLDATFPPLPPATAAADSSELRTPTGAAGTPHDMAALIGQHIRTKTVETVQACKAMLLREPIERFKDFWGTPAANDHIKPLTKKLRKCRDPDRFDLIALHKKRLEFRGGKDSTTTAGGTGAGAGGADVRVPQDDDVFGGSLAATAGPAKSEADREAKRRKVAAEDPFGPAL